jgi:hypothetical protein
MLFNASHFLLIFSSLTKVLEIKQAKPKIVRFQKSYYFNLADYNWGRRMDKEKLVDTFQLHCDHENQRLYTDRRFDVLNGFELTYTRCINCHKIVSLEAKKFSSQ